MDYTIKNKLWISALTAFCSLCLIMHCTIQLLDAFRKTSNLIDLQDANKKNSSIVEIEDKSWENFKKSVYILLFSMMFAFFSLNFHLSLLYNSKNNSYKMTIEKINAPVDTTTKMPVHESVVAPNEIKGLTPSEINSIQPITKNDTSKEDK